MSLRKKEYKDIDKWRDTLRKQHTRYRERTGANLYEGRYWSKFEDELVLNSDMTDRELSEYIKRSVGAIQHRRYRLKRDEVKIDEVQFN